MRVLVTGGAGFIGSYLCANLTARGHQATALDAFRSYAWPSHDPGASQALRFRRESLLDGVELIRMDMLDQEQLRLTVRRVRPECIVHLAGLALVSEAERRPAEATADTLQSTLNILEVVKRMKGIARFVFVSSSMIYGNFDGDEVRETSPAHPINQYGALKLAGERATRACLAGTATEAVIVRPTGVYGPADASRRVVQIFCESALAGVPLTLNDGPGSVIDFTYVEDLVDGLRLACTAPAAAGETFNLAFGMARELAELAEILRSWVPGLEIVRGSTSDLSRPRRGSLNIGKARRLLGYDPAVNLEDGIARCIAHLLREEPLNHAAGTTDRRQARG